MPFMPSVPLEFPVLVTPSKNGYHLRPLFLDSPDSHAKRFRDAVDLLSKEVRRQFRAFETERKTIDDLLWFSFNPQLKFERKTLYFTVGHHTIFGDFLIVRFSLKGHQILCLPQFDNFFAIISQNILEDGSFSEQLTAIVRDRLLEERKNNPDDFSPNDYYASGGEFVTNTSVKINIKQARFPFEEQIDAWFASVSGQAEKFSGAAELARVGSNLQDDYPNNLSRDSLRDVEVDRLSSLIFGAKMTAIVIVGSTGCGRTTLLHECFYRYLQAQEAKEKQVKKATIWHIDPNRVISGMSIVGMWQRRFESILDYIIKRRPASSRPRLFVDNLVAFFRVGKSAQNSMTLSDVLKPYLEQRALTFIAEVTPEEWNVVLETDRRFADLCQVIRLNEPSLVETARIALKERGRLELLHECEIDNEAIERLFALTHSVLRGMARPGNVVAFLERIAAKYRSRKVGIEQVETAISEITQMSSSILDRNKTLVRKEVEQSLAAQLIGQPEAVKSLVDVIQTVKAGLQDPKKPISTLLFIGPTGVGKTQAAKVLTRYLFAKESQLIRLDMNEFVTDADVGRLIGSWGRPDGLLTMQVRHQPFSILLLDEIEKAHPAIHDLLLQVLGEGRLTDALGRTTDFTNTIIILTSNLGAEQASRSLGFVERDVKNQASSYRAAVEDFFRPELLNRIDRLVVFNPLALQDAVTITRLQLDSLLQRDGFVRRTTILNISEKALLEVARRGFDTVLGGRALKRAIERDLTALAAKQLVGIRATDPIILDIDWINERLQPNITALVPVSREKAVLKPIEMTLENVSNLSDLVLDLRAKLYALRDKAGVELDTTASEEIRFLLTMQETVFELKEQLDEILWGMETARDPNEASFNNQKTTIKFNSKYGENIKNADFYAYQDIRDYLEEIYVLAPKLIQESQSHWLSLLMKARFISFFSLGLEQNMLDKVSLRLHSRVHGGGDKALDYLLNCYEKALAYLGIETTRQLKTGQGFRCLEMNGPRLRTLLSLEEGIHLFHPPNENALPIQVSLSDLNNSQHLQIIRHYAPDEKAGVLSDLRTGLLNRTRLDANEWALLWYVQLPMVDK
jgi:ATP-dependent Clp protease ATP-binding subunit ClpC